LGKDVPNGFRNFGVNPVGAVPWGTHLCQLYQTKGDLIDVLVPYFEAGLKNNEFCLWVTFTPLEVNEARKALEDAVPEASSYFKRGQIEIIPHSSFYFVNNEFNPQHVIQLVREKEQIALSKGFDGLRLAGNTYWVGRNLWKTFINYESTVNKALPSHKIITLCSYNLEVCSSNDVIDVECNHVGTLVKRGNGWGLVEDAVQRLESEAEYKDIIQTSIDAFWIVDYRGRFLEVNGAFCELIGYGRDELLTMNVQDLEMNETPEEIMRHIAKVKLQGHDRFETRMQCKDHLPVDIEVSANYISEDGGRVFVFAHNITRRKRNEEVIKHSEASYRELADSIADSFVALNSDLRYVYWNKACERITGIRAEDAIGRHLFEVFSEDEGTQKVANTYLKVMKTGKPRVFIDELEMNGRKVSVENHIYPSRTGVSVFTKDITQRKELQNKLEEYTQRLEDLVKTRTEKLKTAERLATIGETAGMVGHDIRNPLQTICGELYLMKGDLSYLPENEGKKSLTESMQIIGEQLSYINKIVADLQDFARTSLPRLEEVNFEKTLKDIMSTVSVPEDVKVVVSINDGFPVFQSDSSYLKRIFINLVTNAVQAMPNGGTLTVTASCDGKKAVIFVEDTGQGIPENFKEKIFKPLFTTKAKGQGLGLAVVKKLTNALGGNIAFESAVGKGTRFTVEIPLRVEYSQ
jgi:PAS domain S-box-containing protein